MSEQFDLVIVRAGPGSYSDLARRRTRHESGTRPERDATVGGTCLNRGCIPSRRSSPPPIDTVTVRPSSASTPR